MGDAAYGGPRPIAFGDRARARFRPIRVTVAIASALRAVRPRQLHR